ncbi:hypothetical protein ABBQ32_005411 [Trebouxia sp. C0010 RCD-2024]
MACTRDAVGAAIRKCPFLHQVSTDQGEEYARRIATRPACPAAASYGPIFEERSCDFQATLKLFHGPSGVVPLERVAASLAKVEQTPEPAQHNWGNRRSEGLRKPRQQICKAPFASINMAGAFNFLPGPHDVANLLFGKNGSNVGKPRHSKSSSNSGRTTAGAAAATGAAAAKAAEVAQQSGQCPLRKFPGAKIVGGLIPLSAKGKLQCPRAIVVGRAFVARLQPVRDLRPQALPVKLATLGAGTTVLNVPFGMWREHTRKFSPEWFLAVHATIPFVAMTRQGIGMPKTVIFLTIASAILGQALGARLERQRLLPMESAQAEVAIEADRPRDRVRDDSIAKPRGPAFPLDCAFAQVSHDSMFSKPGNHVMSLAHNLLQTPVAAVGA